MRIQLTKQQRALLKPLFDSAQTALRNGDPGAVIAQVWDDTEAEESFIEARFLDSETMMEIQAITGVRIGKVANGETVRVLTLEGE